MRCDVCEGTCELSSEAELDDPTIGVELCVATNEVVQVPGRCEGRVEDPRKCSKKKTDDLRKDRAVMAKPREPPKWSSRNAAGSVADAGTEQHGQAEPLSERQADRVRTQVMAELVRDNARQFVIVEVLDRE